MDWLDIVDENGEPTGETVERSFAHQNGVMHRTAHVWLFRKSGNQVEILLQKRSNNKDSFPGCYDISSAGHIPAGDDYVESGLRELEEELGLVVGADELIECGIHKVFTENEFHGIHYVDNQLSKVFLLWKDLDVEALDLQEEEIESAMWMDFDSCKEAVRNQTIPTCINITELELLEEHM